MRNINVNGVSLRCDEPVPQDRDWTLVRVSGSSGSAIIRGKHGKALEKRDVTLSGDELTAFLYAHQHGLFDSLIY